MKSIIKNKNKILYAIDQGVIQFVSLTLLLVEKITPKNLSAKIALLREHQTALYNVFGLMILNAIGGFLLLLTQVKIANVLGASVYGLYSYYIALGEVGAMVVRYGRNKTMLRDLVQKPEIRTSLITNTFVLGLLNLFLYFIIILILNNPLDITINITTILLIISPCLVSLDFQPVYETLRMMSWHSIYNILQKSFYLFFIWITILSTGSLNLGVLSIVLFLSWILILVGQIIEVKSILDSNWKQTINIQNIKNLYKDNFIIALSCFFGIAFGPLIRLILNKYTDSTSVGIYAAGLQIYLIGKFILNQVGRVGNPMMAEVGKNDCSIEKRRKFVNNYLLVMIASTLPFAIPIIFFPRFVTSLFFSHEYSELAHYLPILGMYLVVFAIGVVFTQFLISMRKDRTYFAIYIGGAILTFITSYIIIPELGVLGAVLSLCIPHALSCICYCLFSLNFLKDVR